MYEHHALYDGADALEGGIHVACGGNSLSFTLTNYYYIEKLFPLTISIHAPCSFGMQEPATRPAYCSACTTDLTGERF